MISEESMIFEEKTRELAVRGRSYMGRFVYTGHQSSAPQGGCSQLQKDSLSEMGFRQTWLSLYFSVSFILPCSEAEAHFKKQRLQRALLRDSEEGPQVPFGAMLSGSRR